MSSPSPSDISDYLNGQMLIIQNTLKDKFGIDITLDEYNQGIQQRITFDIHDIGEKHLLKKKNLSDLKNICKQYGLRYSGKKEDLIDRIWGVKFPDEAPADSKPKKRGRKTKSRDDDIDSLASSPRIVSQSNEQNSGVSSPINSTASSPISP